MITDIIQEIVNVMFTLISALFIGWFALKLFNYRIFDNFRMTDDDIDASK